MLNHIIFIGLYILLAEFVDPIYMHVLSILHYSISILQLVNKSKFVITPEILLYLMSIQISAGNFILINTLGTPDQSKSYYYIVPKYITQASVLWLVGTEIFFMGYKYFNKVSLPKIKYELTQRSTDGLIKVIVATIFITPILARTFPFIGSIIKLFELLGSVGIMFYSRLWGETGESKYGKNAILVTILQTWFALSNAYLRMALILPTVVLIVGYISGTKKVKSLFSVKLLPFLMFGALFFAFLAN